MLLAPPAPGVLWREVCSGDALIDGERVPQRYDVEVCQYAICYNADYFPDPYIFKPKRFLAPQCQERSRNQCSMCAKSNPCPRIPQGLLTTLPLTPNSTEKPPTFAPFLIGPRSCVAKLFAYLEMSLAIAGLVWLMDFRVTSSSGEGSPGCGIAGREREEEFQIVEMFSSSKEGSVLQWRRRMN